MNFDQPENDRDDLAIITIKIAIKDDNLKSFLYYINHFNIEPTYGGGYFIRYARRFKAHSIIRFLVKLQDFQNIFNMSEDELLIKFLYR